MATKFQEGGQHEAQRSRLGPPKMYKVMLLNDDYTPMDFVITVLQRFFHWTLNKRRESCSKFTTKVEACAAFSRATSPQPRLNKSLHSPASTNTRSPASWRKTDDRPGTRSQPAHGLCRGASKTPRVHHRRTPPAGADRQPVSRRSLARLRRQNGHLRKDLTNFIDEHTPTVSGEDDIDTQPTLGFQRVIQRAILHVQSSGKKEVNGANVLVAIYGEKDSHAVYFLQKQGVTRLDVVNFIARHQQGAAAEGSAGGRSRDRRRKGGSRAA
jgi:hypothetical protein